MCPAAQKQIDCELSLLYKNLDGVNDARKSREVVGHGCMQAVLETQEDAMNYRVLWLLPVLVLAVSCDTGLDQPANANLVEGGVLTGPQNSRGSGV